MSAAREVAWLALRTGIGPADLLAAPAAVYDQIVELVAEQVAVERETDRARRHEARVAALKQRMGG